MRLFLEVARAGSFRRAAENSGLAANTLMRRIGSLEKRLGHILLARRTSGIEITAEGYEVRKVAERLEQEAASLEWMARGASYGLSGALKISVTEGLGTFWLIPRLVDFRQKHPALTIDLHCDMQPANLRSHESDLSVQFDRPTEPELLVTRLGYLHLVLFESDEYVRLHGAPANLQDLVKYQFVEQVAPQVPSEMLTQLVPNPFGKHFVSIRANTSSAHAYAIARGAGIGLLPTYARAITRRVKPIGIDFKLRRDIWLVYHPKVRSIKTVRAAIAWLRDAFDAERYPWFREEFVPPDKFDLDPIPSDAVHLFEGFLERDP